MEYIREMLLRQRTALGRLMLGGGSAEEPETAAGHRTGGKNHGSVGGYFVCSHRISASHPVCPRGGSDGRSWNHRISVRREAFAKLPAAPDQPVLPSAQAAAIAVRDGEAAAKAALAADRRPENTKSGAVSASDGEGRMAGASANGRKSPFQ